MAIRLWESVPEKVSVYPWLKMHILADMNRLSAFFQWEDREESLKRTIEELANRYLGVSVQEIETQLKEAARTQI